jgi:hypothetical protein
MCDESVIVRGRGTIFLAGPPLVAAATGEKVSAEELGGGEMHTRVSGVADHLAESEEEGCEMAREIVERIRDVPRGVRRAPEAIDAGAPDAPRAAARLSRENRAFVVHESGASPEAGLLRALAGTTTPWVALRTGDVGGLSLRSLSPRFLFSVEGSSVAGLSALESSARLFDDGVVTREDVDGLLSRLFEVMPCGR